ncbi:MAG: tryptophanase [Desulfurococcaceae archaeon]|nr:tryptophanase [Desulfurococcaceae archaeon]
MIIVRSRDGSELRVDGYRVRFFERIDLPPIDRRLKAIREAGWNTFQLKADDVFLDMLTDSGVNAMSINQLAAMMSAQDAYAGSRTFYEFAETVEEILSFKYVIPVHQGRAAEHLLAKVFVREGSIVPMNYHFTTTKTHIDLAGGIVVEIPVKEALDIKSRYPFKGDIDVSKLEEILKKERGKVAFVRIEAVANLLGGQPVSMKNIREVRELCDRYGVPLVLDGSMVDWNVYFIKEREPGYRSKKLVDILREFVSYSDIFYMSARKAPSVRGGFIATNNREFYEKIVIHVPVYEGFPTYGGMSIKEIAAMAIGLREMVDENLIGSELELIKYVVEELDKRGIPVVLPPGGLGVHIEASQFLPHVPRNAYPAGSLAAALYLASGVRSMERGAMSMDRDRDGREIYPDLELIRIAFPRRTYLKSHADYLIDRVLWLYEHRDIVEGLRWIYEPPVLRFFLGRLEDIGNWGEKLVEVYKKELGDL